MWNLCMVNSLDDFGHVLDIDDISWGRLYSYSQSLWHAWPHEVLGLCAYLHSLSFLSLAIYILWPWRTFDLMQGHWLHGGPSYAPTHARMGEVRRHFDGCITCVTFVIIPQSFWQLWVFPLTPEVGWVALGSPGSPPESLLSRLAQQLDDLVRIV